MKNYKIVRDGEKFRILFEDETLANHSFNTEEEAECYIRGYNLALQDLKEGKSIKISQPTVTLWRGYYGS